VGGVMRLSSGEHCYEELRPMVYFGEVEIFGSVCK
jgi:hypothetical protein